MSDGQGFGGFGGMGGGAPSGQGFGGFAGTAAPEADEEFNLDFGLETTDGLAKEFGQIPPAGVHRFKIKEKPSVEFTKDGEPMMVVECVVIQSTNEEAMDTVHKERLVIPGDDRRVNNEKSWKGMMKMLRMRLEGMTGRQYREDKLKVGPSHLHHCEFIARIWHEQTKEKDDFGNDVEGGKVYTNSRMADYAPVNPQNGNQQGYGGTTPPAALPGTTAADPPF